MPRRHAAIIRNATLFDGTGAAPRVCDLTLEGDRIGAVGAALGDAALEIDAAGLAVAPGFIDVHTHDDFAAILYAPETLKSPYAHRHRLRHRICADSHPRTPASRHRR